ncbi:MAG TPA: hypothetical protein VEU55_11055 [Gemmatimonadales bacterium]|nr:hypothetical protein [Gemmatimonadales bacterium]
MPHLRIVLALGCLALAPAACARHRARAYRAVPAEWSLTIDNHHWLDVEVSVLHGGQTTRVGLITAATSQSFVLPTYLLGPGGDIRLIATPIGGGQSVVTPLITIGGGQSVDWTLERTLSTSSLAIH